MTELEGFSYAVFAVYTLTSVGLAVALRKLGFVSAPPLPLIAFAAAGLWPLLHLAVGDVVSSDPLQQRFDGLTGDLIGHALLAAGALTAMMAEVQILTRARMAALSPAEPQASSLLHRCVAGGRIVQLVGLLAVFPGLVLAGLMLVATAVIVRTPQTNPHQVPC